MTFAERFPRHSPYARRPVGLALLSRNLCVVDGLCCVPAARVGGRAPFARCPSLTSGKRFARHASRLAEALLVERHVAEPHEERSPSVEHDLMADLEREVACALTGPLRSAIGCEARRRRAAIAREHWPIGSRARQRFGGDNPCAARESRTARARPARPGVRGPLVRGQVVQLQASVNSGSWVPRKGIEQTWPHPTAVGQDFC